VKAVDRTTPAETGAVRGEVWFASPERPAPGVEVVLGSDPATARTSRTDDAGRFVAAGLPEGFRGLLRVHVEGYATVSRPLMPLRRGETRDVGLLWLAPAAGARFVVLDSESRPVEGAVVSAWRTPANSFDPSIAWAQRRDVRDADAEARTDAAGRAAFADLERDMWTFVAKKAGLASVSERDRILAAGRNADEITLYLFPGVSLSGRVVDRVGRGVGGVMVWAATSLDERLGDVVTPCAVSDAAGRYCLDGLADGDYQVSVSRPGNPRVHVGAVRVPAASP